MKKIGIVVNSLGYGGNERSAVNIAKALSDKFDIIIITQEDNGNQYGYSGKVINLDTPCATSIFGKVMNSMRRIIRLKRIIRRAHIDTLLLILPVSNPINYMRWDCRKIVSCRDCGDLMRNTDKYLKMLHASDAMVCNSQYMRSLIIAQDPSAEERVYSIYNILDVDRVITQKKETPEEWFSRFVEGHPVITAAGRFDEAKGWSNLIKAFYLLVEQMDARLVLMGDGMLRPQIQRLIDQLGLQHQVLLPGFQENPFRYIHHSSAFVLPSLFEGFPNMMIEAMACGVPVIASDCPSGPAEILETTVIGDYILAEAGILMKYIPKEETSWDASDIRDGHRKMAEVMSMLCHNAELSFRLSQNAVCRAQDFTDQAISKAWQEVFESNP